VVSPLERGHRLKMRQTTWFETVLMIGFDCLFFRRLESVNPRPFDTAAEDCWHRLVLGSVAGCSRSFLGRWRPCGGHLVVSPVAQRSPFGSSNPGLTSRMRPHGWSDTLRFPRSHPVFTHYYSRLGSRHFFPRPGRAPWIS
jgi:hypothetical protein